MFDWVIFHPFHQQRLDGRPQFFRVVGLRDKILRPDIGEHFHHPFFIILVARKRGRENDDVQILHFWVVPDFDEALETVLSRHTQVEEKHIGQVAGMLGEVLHERLAVVHDGQFCVNRDCLQGLLEEMAVVPIIIGEEDMERRGLLLVFQNS